MVGYMIFTNHTPKHIYNRIYSTNIEPVYLSASGLVILSAFVSQDKEGAQHHYIPHSFLYSG